MEQLYLLEIFIDKVTIFDTEKGDTGQNKQLIVKARFGPTDQFIFKEGQLAPSNVPDHIVESDGENPRKWTRTFRVGKSYLFPSYPDTMLHILDKFPLEFEVWTDDETEVNILVGIGTMLWNTEFYVYLKNCSNICQAYEATSIKQVIPIRAECCCAQAGEVAFILRFTALGDTIVTAFQQLMSDPYQFYFKSEKAPSKFQCKLVEDDDRNFNMAGSIYEIATKEDPDIVADANRKLEVCTELESCRFGQKGIDEKCQHKTLGKPNIPRIIDKIRMGDITGPCGNKSCPLVQRVKNYIRNLEGYKQETYGIPIDTKKTTGKVCGACSCKNNPWNPDACKNDLKDGKLKDKSICEECGGVAESGETCEDKVSKFYGTGVTPKQSNEETKRNNPPKSNVNYLISTTRLPPEEMRSLFGKDFVVNNLTTKYNYETSLNQVATSEAATLGCHCRSETPEKPNRPRTIDKIRMGDITGPCGNTSCPLADRVKNYIRNLEGYKKETYGIPIDTKKTTEKVCDACSCKNERWHRDACIEDLKDGKLKDKPICKEGCGVAQSDETCEDKASKFYGTGVTPKQSNEEPKRGNNPPKSNVNYLISTTKLPPGEMRSLFGKNLIVNNLTTEDNYGTSRNQAPVSQAATLGCHFGRSELTSVNTQLKNINSAPNIRAENRVSSRSFGYTNAWVYNAEVKETSTRQINNFCTDIPEDSNCKCNPPIPSGACKTFDCDCITETLNIAARKAHKPFCPLYKHKPNCPVMMQDEEEKNEFEEDEPEPLPYGLPPIQLGPCPVLGRPCTVPDGFARMYKTAAVPAQMPTYSDAGKICCSKEYERIKKAVREYMNYQKDNDLKCITKYNVDTEKRCCDKEQVLLALMGKSCCGSHKMAIQEQYEDQEKK